MKRTIDFALFSDVVCNDKRYSNFDSERGQMKPSLQIPLLQAYEAIRETKKILILGRASHGKSTALRVFEAEHIYRENICMLIECGRLFPEDIEKIYGKVNDAGAKVIIFDAYDELKAELDEPFCRMLSKLADENEQLQIVVSSKALMASDVLVSEVESGTPSPFEHREVFKDYTVMTILPFTYEQLDSLVDASVNRSSGYFRLLQTPMFLSMYMNLKDDPQKRNDSRNRIDTEATFIRAYFNEIAKKKTEGMVDADYEQLGGYVFDLRCGVDPEPPERIPSYLRNIFYFTKTGARNDKRKTLESINRKFLNYAVAVYLKRQFEDVIGNRRRRIEEIVDMLNELPDTDESKEAIYFAGQLMSEHAYTVRILKKLNETPSDKLDYEKSLSFFLGVSKDNARDIEGVFTFFRPELLNEHGELGYVRGIIRELSAGSVENVTFWRYEFPALERISVQSGRFYSENDCLIKRDDYGLWLGCNNSVIPDGVRYVHHHAFNRCPMLKSVKIPSTVLSIDHLAFINCEMLRDVEIGENVRQISENAFYDCQGIKSVAFKNKRMCFGKLLYDLLAFERSKEIEDLELPTCAAMFIDKIVGNSLKRISIHQGEDVRGKKVPFSLTECSKLGSLKEIHIARDVEDITEDCFYRLRNGIERITVEEGNARYRSENNCLIKNNRNALMLGCKNSVFPPPADVKVIMPYAFSKIAELRDVDIGDHVEEIGESAFAFCHGLEVFRAGKSLKKVGKAAFSYCNAIRRVIVDDVQAWSQVIFLQDTSHPMRLDSVLEDNCGEISTLEIKDGTERISMIAFYKCSSIRKVVLPASITEIGGAAFLKCSRLEEVHISDLAAWCKIRFNTRSANPLDNYARLFLNGTEVRELLIPREVERIPKFCFNHAAGIETVIFEGDVTLEDYAFLHCPNLKRVIFNSHRVSIAKNAFKHTGTEVIYTGTDGQWQEYVGNEMPEGIESLLCLKK